MFDLDAELELYREKGKSRKTRKSKKQLCNISKIKDNLDLKNDNIEVCANTHVTCDVHNDIGTFPHINWDNAAKAGLFCDSCIIEIENRYKKHSEGRDRLQKYREDKSMEVVKERTTISNFKFKRNG